MNGSVHTARRSPVPIEYPSPTVDLTMECENVEMRLDVIPILAVCEFLGREVERAEGHSDAALVKRFVKALAKSLDLRNNCFKTFSCAAALGDANPWDNRKARVQLHAALSEVPMKAHHRFLQLESACRTLCTTASSTRATREVVGEI